MIEWSGEANMILTAFVQAVFVFCALIAAFFISYRVIRSRILSIITDFVSSPSDGVLSPLATIIDSASKTAGHSIALEAKTTLMGKASAVSRNEAGIMSDIASDQINSQMPLIGSLLDTMPSLKKRLIKNPGLLASLAGILQTAGGEARPSPAGGNGQISKAKFNL